MKMDLNLSYAFILVTILFAAGAQAQTKEQPTEYGKLSALVGRWTIQGMEDRFLEVCGMYEGGYFVVCNSEFTSKSGVLNKGVSIIGYSAENKYYTYYHYGSTGTSQVLKGDIDEQGNIFFNGEVIINEKLTRTRVAMTKDGENYDFKEETSVENGPWEVSASFKYIRLK